MGYEVVKFFAHFFKKIPRDPMCGGSQRAFSDAIPLFGFRCNIGNININIGISFLVSWDFFGTWNFG